MNNTDNITSDKVTEVMYAKDLINIIGFFEEIIDHVLSRCIRTDDNLCDSELTRLTKRTWTRDGERMLNIRMIEFATILDDLNYKYQISHEDNVAVINYIHETYFSDKELF